MHPGHVHGVIQLSISYASELTHFTLSRIYVCFLNQISSLGDQLIQIIRKSHDGSMKYWLWSEASGISWLLDIVFVFKSTRLIIDRRESHWWFKIFIHHLDFGHPIIFLIRVIKCKFVYGIIKWWLDTMKNCPPNLNVCLSRIRPQMHMILFHLGINIHIYNTEEFSGTRWYYICIVIDRIMMSISKSSDNLLLLKWLSWSIVTCNRHWWSTSSCILLLHILCKSLQTLSVLLYTLIYPSSLRSILLCSRLRS